MLRRWSLALLAAAGCGEPIADVSPDAGMAPEPPVVAVALPAAPILPKLGPCPEGWVAGATGSVPTCAPWASAATCSGAEAQIPGKLGCEPIGRQCGAGEWPEDLPDRGALIFVRAGAAAGGDGSRGAPLASIRTALLQARPGATIVLGAGTFDEPLVINTAVTIRGLCPERTRLTATGALANPAVIIVRTTQVAIRDVAITGPRWAVQVGPRQASLALRGVLIEDTMQAALAVAGPATVDADRLIIRDTGPAPDRTAGRAVVVQGGGRLRLANAVIERHRQVAVFAAGAGTEVTVEDTVIRGLQGQLSDRRGGFGVEASGGAIVDLHRVLIDGATTSGVTAYEAGSRVRLWDSIVQDTLPAEWDGGRGQGLHVSEHARIEARRTQVTRSVTTGVEVDGGAIELADVVIMDTDSRLSDGAWGQGLELNRGGIGSLARVVIERSRWAGIVLGSTATLDATDLVVRSTQARRSDSRGGAGLIAIPTASASVTRALLEYNTGAGLMSKAATIRLTDVTVQHVLAEARDQSLGLGLGFGWGSTVALHRVRVADVRTLGLTVQDSGTRLTGRDLVIDGVESREADGHFGRGINVQSGAQVALQGVKIVGAQELGLLVIGAGSTVEAAELEIRGTLPAACGETTCGDSAAGFGVAVVEGGYAKLERFLIANNTICGIQLASGGTGDLVDGEIVGHDIGINVQTEGFGLERLTTGVSYRDNTVNLDARILPIPEASSPLEL